MPRSSTARVGDARPIPPVLVPDVLAVRHASAYIFVKFLHTQVRN